MKTTIFSTVLLILASMFSSETAAQNDHQATFEHYLKTVYAAFENGGIDGILPFYASNAGEIGPDGRFANGIAAIEANWAEMEKMLEGKPKFKYQLTSWRLIKPDLAIITWDSEDEFKMMGQVMVFKNSCSALLRKEGDRWLIEFDQTTPKMDFDPQAQNGN